MITSSNILPLLAEAIGRPVDLIAEEVQDDGQVLVTWSCRLPDGEMRFEREPPLLISADRETLTWADGRPGNTFTLKDLAESNPAEESNRHSQTKELALRLAERLRATKLMSPSGAAALAAILDELPMHPESTAALVAAATGEDFWDILKHALFAHEYRYRDSGLRYPPYSLEEEAEARRLLSEPWFTEALRKQGKIVNRQVYLTVVANENAGLF